MVNWVGRFEEKAIVEKLNQLELALNTTNQRVQDLEDPAELESYNRIHAITIYTRKKLDSVDPLIIPVAVLDEIESLLQTVNNEVNNFINDGNPAHLVNANNHADSLIVSLSKIPFQVLPIDIDGIRDSVASFRRSAGQLIRNLESEYKKSADNYSELGDKIQSITSEINTQKGRLDTAISQFQQQFSEAEERRRSKASEEKEMRKEENEVVINEFREKAASGIDTFKDESSAALDKVIQESTATKEKVNDEAIKIIGEMEKYKNKAGELVTIVTNSGLIGGYQEIANKDRRRSTFWQGVAILSFIGLIIFAVFAFLETVQGGFDWGRFGARAFAAATFGILGAYCARQADRHEMSERKNRKMELELAAIAPYLYELPVATQHKIKEELASKLFAQHDGDEMTNFNSRTSGSIVDILKMAIETINNLSKKGAG